jgi:hypothetical protein
MNVSALNDIVVIGREVKVKKDLTEVAAFMTGAAQLGSWISPVKSVEAKLHGVIEFRSEPGFEHRGTYTVFDSPDHFILLTDKFGEIDVHFKQVDANTIVNFKFSKLGDESYERIVSDAVTRFIAMVNYK